MGTGRSPEMADLALGALCVKLLYLWWQHCRVCGHGVQAAGQPSGSCSPLSREGALVFVFIFFFLWALW